LDFEFPVSVSYLKVEPVAASHNQNIGRIVLLVHDVTTARKKVLAHSVVSGVIRCQRAEQHQGGGA
jgi:hypothetical protein